MNSRRTDIRFPGGSVRPEGTIPPGQRNSGAPATISGSPTMQSSAVWLTSSYPSTIGTKTLCAPKSTGLPGRTASLQGSRSRPIAARGTSTWGCSPSLDSITSVACDIPVVIGVNETRRSTFAPGGPTVIAPPWTAQVPSLPSIHTPVSTSGTTFFGSTPTFVTVTGAVRVVPSAVAPTKRDFGSACSTGPIPVPVIVRMPGPPSEARSEAWAC